MFVLDKEPKSIAAEAYRILRTNIEYSSYDKKIQTIVVTSSQPAEGKSTTAGNLGLAFSEYGKRTIIIDCDLRRPSIHKKMLISNEAGLSEIILGIKKAEDCIQSFNGKIDVITAGKIPPNPSELLGSKRMLNFLKALKEIYDYIIIDAPPILAVTDAQILAANVDGVVLVVKYGKTKKDSVLEAKKQLDKVKANIIGSVITQVESGQDEYYYYYGEEGHKQKRKR
ncbi:MAG: CpsD/CapB family tyrosine-protein kinase [Sarcina sp.]